MGSRKGQCFTKGKEWEEVQHAKKFENVDIAKEQEEGPLCHEESFTTPPTYPHKLVGSREYGVEAKQVAEDAAKGEAHEVFEDLAKQEEAVGIQDLKVYLEIELVDGRLAHQCRASADCPKRSAFIFKRLRMMSHLKTFHGITVEIAKRHGGHPLHKEAKRRANLMPNLEVKSWHKAALKRFGNKD
ncbi:hypothetical protein GOP47_0015234 [Adiantum capillus-veneris]|uniref:Uncharacterized protein n=1 Tax=Adiantum capillus-veneris TaxID=13818 RepID=A0A9D4ZB34_ADICA|nr:hypothetical protein GOP47_0015234 [Adiantum capillus-veneris]